MPFFASARYPERSITLVVPAPAGTNLDGGARIVADALAGELGQTFIVQNVAGAMGQLGVQHLLSRNPNGCVLCYCNDGSVITVPVSYKSMKEKPPYDGISDLAPIAQSVEEVLGADSRSALSPHRTPGRPLLGQPGDRRVLSSGILIYSDIVSCV